MNYNKYRYLYPPRPKNCVNPTELPLWDNNSLVAQPKLNGSNCVIFMDGSHNFVMNRHNQRLTNFTISPSELNNIYKCKSGEWMVINGEYLNKSQRDENNLIFNHKLVIFDILVFKSDYLVGSTFIDRINLLDDIYGKVESEKNYLYSISDNIYRVKSYDSGFKELFDNLTTIDVVEGLVLKRKNAKLEVGNAENNNSRSQIKSRKKTKNYSY